MRSEFFVVALLLAAPSFADALVGAGVGNADTLVSEGSKLYNQKKYPAAVTNFTRATRANPALLPPYLNLARSLLAAKQVQRACYAYRVYLKATPESPDRKKAQAESEQCERQLKGAKGQPPDKTQAYVELRAAFFASLDKGELLGKDSAFESLKSLVTDGFLGPELGDMAAKFATAAAAAADDVHKRALAWEKLPTETLRSARGLYQASLDTGGTPAEVPGRTAFLDGLAALQSKELKKADALFADAVKASPHNKEYVFCRGLALVQAGDRKGALKVLDADLKDDPRTEVLRAALAVGDSPEAGAAELERLLFTRRYPADK